MDPNATGDTSTSKIPIGVPSIDSRLRGGIRPGTTLLAMGPFGTGHHEFLRTIAILHGNWQAESDLFELAYGEVSNNVRQPSQVRYLSINDSETRFQRNLHDTGSSEWVDTALEHISFHSLANDVADLGPVKPAEKGTGFTYESKEERPSDKYQQVFRRFDDLIEEVPGEIAIVDSISDFLPITSKFLDPMDLYFISQTLCHVAAESNSILIAGADSELLTERERALLKRTFEGVLNFGWFGQGSQQRRTMTVTKFPEFWREADPNGRVTFDLDIDRDRFGISSTEKIPPSKL
ncbi:hypothetical protein [Halorubrum sp. Atlit-26R]|uniref:RAD55 family ATPase n=1 Tax=Halorubrum sp. Atlit-26R TaxID=2282128 RepID=UPI0011C38BC0|nr:hypothetical protein [Halorubrum sp. Atlit-26R]